MNETTVATENVDVNDIETQVNQDAESLTQPSVDSETNAPDEMLEKVLSEAKKLRFVNPALAAKLAMAEQSPIEELNRLAREEKYMIGRVVSPSNPTVDREIPGSVSRIRRALHSKRLRLYK